MAIIYSQTFLVQHDLDGSSAAFGPQPGFIFVVKGVDVVCGNTLGVVTLEGPAGQAIWANDFSNAIGFAYASYRGSYVLEPAEVAFVTTNAAMDVSVWGYNLTLP